MNVGVQGRHHAQICRWNLNGEMIGVQVRRMNLKVQGRHPAWAFWSDVFGELAGVQVRSAAEAKVVGRWCLWFATKGHLMK